MPRLTIVLLEDRATPAIFTVTSAADSGVGTLRTAITSANAAGGNDTIAFNIPGAAGISLASALPVITDTLIIDGRTQPGYDMTAKLPLVELIGNSLAISGLVVQSVNCQILGVNVHNFGVDGIRLESANTLVDSCFVGTDRTGKVDLGNTDDGIDIIGSNNIVRDSLISGNNDDGIQLLDGGANNNSIRGNRIGTDVTGTIALGNSKDAVHIHNAPLNVVGGNTPVDRNIISANGRNTSTFHQGVHIDQEGSDSNTVIGNYIGTDITGTKDLGNGVGGGIRVDVGPDNNTISGNVISGNQARGITIRDSSTNGTVVIGNIIGLNAACTAGIANDNDSISIYNGPSGTRVGTNGDGVNDDAEANVLSGNSEWGIIVSNDTLTVANTVIAGNMIGTNPTGDLAFGNDSGGIYLKVAGTGATISGNVISGNGGIGVQILTADFVTVRSNRIGVNKSGTAAVPNTGDGIHLDSGASTNTIGGNTPGTGNIISGNGDNGIHLADSGTDSNVIVGNLIGVNAAGAAAIPNGGIGIRNEGGASNTRIGTNSDGVNDAAEANVISGNGSSGISLNDTTTSNAVIRGNRIGTNAAGTSALPNAGYGITLQSATTGHLIESNLISGNALQGIRLTAGSNDNDIVNNFIGTNAVGNLPISNGGGVWLLDSSSNNRITANTISNNNGDGVLLSESGPFMSTLWSVNSHTYVLVPSRDWPSAEAAAVAAGGHLASITNAAEQSFVVAFLNIQAPNERVLFGLNDRATEGQ